MSGRRVLVCSTHYWPETTGNAPYVTQVCEHLAARGDKVTVATGVPHYPQWRRRGDRQEWHVAERNGVRIRRRSHYVPASPTALRRMLYELSLAGTGVTALAGGRTDVVLGVVPSLAGGVLAAAASAAHRAPLGLVFQDLLGQGAAQNGVDGGKRVAATVQKVELALARRARGVGVIAEGFRPYLLDGGVEGPRLRVLRNWTHAAEPTETVEETRTRLGWGPAEFIYLHSGNMGQKQGLANLVEAAAVLPDRGCEGVRVVLAGDGNDRPRLLEQAQGLHNVSFVGIQPAGQYEAMLRAADVLVVHQRPSLADAALASKLTSYFAAGRPVLAVAATESETAREVERAGAGPVTPPGEPMGLAEAMIALVRDGERLRTFGENALRYSRDELSARKALGDYEAFIDGLLEVAG